MLGYSSAIRSKHWLELIAVWENLGRHAALQLFSLCVSYNSIVPTAFQDGVSLVRVIEETEAHEEFSDGVQPLRTFGSFLLLGILWRSMSKMRFDL